MRMYENRTREVLTPVLIRWRHRKGAGGFSYCFCINLTFLWDLLIFCREKSFFRPRGRVTVPPPHRDMRQEVEKKTFYKDKREISLKRNVFACVKTDETRLFMEVCEGFEGFFAYADLTYSEDYVKFAPRLMSF
jgi:hypothetical protein